MDTRANAFAELFSKTNEYLETRVELLKLKALSNTSSLASSLVSSLVIGILILMVIGFLNIGLALWIGEMLGSNYLGFFIIMGFYLLVLIILLIARKAIIVKPVKNLLIRTFLN